MDEDLGRAPLPAAAAGESFFLCLEALGSDHLLMLRGEGFLKMHEYSPRALAFIDGLAEERCNDL